MGIKKRGGIWYARVWLDGKEISRSLKTGNKQLAERRFRSVQSEVWASPAKFATGVFVIRRSMEKFLETADRTRETSTVDRYRQSSVSIDRYIGHIPTDALTRADISAYVDARREDGVTDATIRRDLAALSAMYQSRVRSGEAETNPVRSFDKTGIGNSGLRVRYLLDEPFNRLIDALRVLRPWLVDPVMFAAETGLRLNEQWSLTQDNVISLTSGRRGVVINKTKTHQRRVVPLSAKAEEILDRIKTGSPGQGHLFLYEGEPNPDYWRIRDGLSAAVKMAGEKDFHWHDLRHQAATTWVRSGVPIDRVKDLLGHTSLAMVLRYAHLFPDDLSRAMDTLDATRERSEHGEQRLN